MEKRVKDVAENRATKEQILEQILDQMLEIYRTVVNRKLDYVRQISQFLSAQRQISQTQAQLGNGEEFEVEQENVGVCGKCGSALTLRSAANSRVLTCAQCAEDHFLPKGGQVLRRSDNFRCPVCAYSVVDIKNEKGVYQCEFCGGWHLGGRPLEL